MAKFEFKKNEKKKPRPISETKISKPKETYDPIAITNEVEHDIKEEKPKSVEVAQKPDGKTIPLFA